MTEENTVNAVVKAHDDDVIFSFESLKEFIRLIQRQGISNLDIYSVQNDLLLDDKYQHIYTREKTNNLEFFKEELETKVGHLVIIRHTYPWQDGWKDNTTTNNEYTGRHWYIKSGNTIDLNEVFKSSDNYQNNFIDLDEYRKNGTFDATIDNTQYIIKIRGFNEDGQYTGDFLPSSEDANEGTFLRGDGKWTNQIANDFLPSSPNQYNLGSEELPWKTIYGTATNALKDDLGNIIKQAYGAKLSYNSSNGALQLVNQEGNLIGDSVNITTNTAGATNNRAKLFLIGATAQSSSIQTYSFSDTYMTAGVLHSTRVQNAIFNDYAEYRTTIDLSPGHIVIDNDDGTLSCTTQRLQPGAQVISDTFGNSMGETEYAKTPIAVAGRVLVYTYQDRNNYHAGMAVCSAPNGTVDIMTREEIKNYPDCIVGIVSEIPEYKEWGTNKVKVDNRIWIRIK